MTKWVALDDWIEIKVSGPETIEYLNGIITKDLLLVNDNEFVRAAFLTPQAKVRSVFWLNKSGNIINFYCPSHMKQALVEDLLKYKLSMDVKLEDITEETPNLYLIESDTKIPGLSNENIGFTFQHGEEEPEGQTLLYSDFVSLLVKNGITPTEVMVGENPYELGIDDVITLEKGCFLGQEPISRMYHRGNPRKYIYQVELAENITKDSLPVPIKQNGDGVGEILISANNFALAYLRRTIDSHDGLSTINDISVDVLKRVGTYPKNDRN